MQDEITKKYIVSPAPFRVPWANATWEQARQTFATQRRYLTGILDILFTQGIITSETANLISQAVLDLETSMNELEIALRTEMQEKEENKKSKRK